jgi:RNA polymerase sigma factor (sigma-70 family)
MNDVLALEPEIETDASLVGMSLSGDRDAFGRIVARYQAPICGLAYSACGDVPRSEDLAQEVFITAWRRLKTLEQPERFRAWLYGIARNLINNAYRRSTRDPVADAGQLENGTEPLSDATEPDDEAISREEATILWHVLSGLPQIYREPMVLFYRQDESVQRVAETLDISEEAVRQRLTRGRTMLTNRVSRVIQNGLRRSAPRDVFALAVVGALPILGAATTAKGAVVGFATTKSAGPGATLMTAVLKGLGCFAAVVAVPAAVGTYFGRRLGRDAAGREQQRLAAAKFWRLFIWGNALLLFCPMVLMFAVAPFLPQHSDARGEFFMVLTYWLGLAYPFVPVSLVYWAWQRRRKPADAAATPDDTNAVQEQPAGGGDVPRRKTRRLVLFLTVAATGLLVFCFMDTGKGFVSVAPAQMRDIIATNLAANVDASVMVEQDHSIWGESSGVSRTLEVRLRNDRSRVRYWMDADDAMLALLAQKGINYPTYVSGRDYEVLHTPGRLLPLLTAFVLAIGAMFLLTRNGRNPSPARRTA